MGQSNRKLKPASLSETRRVGALTGLVPINSAGYIGGSKTSTRNAYWNRDNEMYMLTDSVARSYGLNPELLRTRMDYEGYTDARIRELNNDYLNKTNRAIIGEKLFKSQAMPYVAGEEFGLDDVATYINDGRVQLINENWGDGQFLNEKGRWTNIAMGHNYSDNIGIMAATLKAMRDQAKKDFPKASEADLDRYAGAYYNRGPAGGKKYIKSGGKGYKVRRTLETGGKASNWYEDFKENHPVATEVASYLPVVGSAMDVYEAINNPTGENIFNAAISVGSDILGYRVLRNMGKALKTVKGRRIYQEAIDKHNKLTGKLKPNKGGTTPASALAAKEQALMFGYPFAQMTNAVVNAGINYGQQERARAKKSNGGSIHIAPSKRGTFTAAANKHGMGVQAFANRVLANKDSYSPAMVKKANFARNASKWNH